jgi:hypothetical protein
MSAEEGCANLLEQIEIHMSGAADDLAQGNPRHL